MLGKLLKNFSAPPAPISVPLADAGAPAEVLRAATPVFTAEEVLERQGQVEEAERRLRAAAADADDAAALEALGAFLLRRKRYDEAQALLDEALARMPGSAGLLLARGHLAQLRMQVAEAVRYFRMSLALRPGDPQTRFNLATQLL